MKRAAIFALPLLLAWLPSAFAASSLVPGRYNEFDVELPADLRTIAGHGRPLPATRALVTIAVPAKLDMAHEWPVLVVSATSAPGFNSSRALLRAYAETAVAAGWIAIAADPKEAVGVDEDDVPMRLALNTAALAVLARQWPGADKAPLAFGGFSGGAKYSGWLAAAFASEGRKVIGVYLAGINEDSLGEAATQLKLGAAFKLTPVYMQAGEKDRIATLEDHRAVADSLRRAGFRNVRIAFFAGDHVVEPAPLRAALDWFREFATLPLPAK